MKVDSVLPLGCKLGLSLYDRKIDLTYYITKKTSMQEHQGHFTW
jgi:hypothetical protein